MEANPPVPEDDDDDTVDALNAVEHRSKALHKALLDLEIAQQRVQEEAAAFPDDLARLRNKLRSIGTFPVADSLDRPKQ